MKIVKKYAIKFLPTSQYVTKDYLHPLSDDINNAIVFTNYTAAKSCVVILSKKIPKKNFLIITLD